MFDIYDILVDIIISILFIIALLISIAYITLAERKVMGLMQRRIGPNRAGFLGILQPLLDGLKLVAKEIIIPRFTGRIEFIIGPILILILTLIIWIPMPLSIYSFILDFNNSLLYILAISSLNVYIYIFSGWSTYSKYAYIGSLRSIAQLISYEVSIGIILLSIVFLNNSFNLNSFILNNLYIPFIFPLLPLSLLFLFSILAETNRPPFDLPEAESELIAGYLIEFGGFAFASIYLAEYGFILFMSYLFSYLFIGNLLPFFTILILFCYIWIRASLPRLRYDQLMRLGWLNILPFSISYLIFIASLFFIFS